MLTSDGVGGSLSGSFTTSTSTRLLFSAIFFPFEVTETWNAKSLIDQCMECVQSFTKKTYLTLLAINLRQFEILVSALHSAIQAQPNKQHTKEKMDSLGWWGTSESETEHLGLNLTSRWMTGRGNYDRLGRKWIFGLLPFVGLSQGPPYHLQSFEHQLVGVSRSLFCCHELVNCWVTTFFPSILQCNNIVIVYMHYN